MIVVVNPAAGGGRAGREWPRVSAQLRAEGLRFDAVLTSGPGDAARIARRAADEGRPQIVAAGGDGTVYEVVNGLLEAKERPETRLGVLPMGTGSDLCRTFGIPLEAVSAAAALRAGATRRIDAGRLTCAGSRGPITRYFVNIADAGIGGDVADLVNRGFRVINGEVTFSLAAVLTLLRWRNPRLLLDLDGERLELVSQQVVVANCEYYGGGMRIAPGALPDDGLFDVIINGDLGTLETLLLLGKVRAGAHFPHPKLERRSARRVEVSSQSRVGVDADGERPGDLPAVFEVVPGAIELVVPDPQANLSRSSR
ncbi:MAG: diacylglycerol kinase family lipid kinase [Candidatus Dormibacteraeota bacterium]|nr:diacylglycerol kinase family lipid kinase [Candidatus Dormibacteraeota bacterium]